MCIYVTRISQKYRVAKTHRMPYLYVIFRERALQLVALLRKIYVYICQTHISEIQGGKDA